MATSSADLIVEAQAMLERAESAAVQALVRITDLPKWMQAPALGRDMTPIVKLVAAAVLDAALPGWQRGITQAVDEVACPECGATIRARMSDRQEGDLTVPEVRSIAVALLAWCDDNRAERSVLGSILSRAGVTR